MKKILSIAIVASSVAAVALAQLVTSVNIVGYYQVDVPAKSASLAAFSFQEVGGESTRSIQDIIAVGSLTGGTSTGGDNLRIWDPVAQAYQNYYLFNTASTNPIFDGLKMKWVRYPGSLVAATNRIANGQALWIKNNQNVAQVVTMLGEVVDSDVNMASLVEGFNLVGFPFSAAVGINEMSLTNGAAATGAAGADTISVWNTDTQSYNRYYLFLTANTNFNFVNRKWVRFQPAGPLAPTGDQLALGQGLLYQRKTGSGLLTWSEENPYVENL